MRIGLLAGNESWHAGDLRRAAAGLGMEVELVAFRALAARLNAPPGAAEVAAPRLDRAGAVDLAGCDRVLVRSMPLGSLEQVVFRMDALHRLEALGVRVVNPPRALETAIDKYLCAARMAACGLPVPPVAAGERADAALAAFHDLGGDVVVKPIFGAEGLGVRRLRSAGEAEAAFRALEEAGAVILIQRFIAHPGFDYRVFTLGERVLCGMRRIAGAAEPWITNVARGARAEPAEVTAEIGDLARRAAAAAGAEMAGVDILPGNDGKLWVLEVNACPGWKALSAATGIDVAREVLLYLAPPGER